MGQYDLQESNTIEHFVGSIDLPDKWNIGLIVGRSGSGKTTFQGVGIGTAFTTQIAQMYADEGKTYISTTSNPAMIFARSNSTKWRTTRIGRASRGSQNGKIQNRNRKGSTSANRITVSFEYNG